MTSLWRNPVLPVGVLLFVLGMGNWLVSRNKLFEYGHRHDADSSMTSSGPSRDFPRLTPRTDTALLERLHRGLADYTFTAAKLDFYTVVHSGGRFLSVLGLLLIAVAIVQSWHGRRSILPSIPLPNGNRSET